MSQIELLVDVGDERQAVDVGRAVRRTTMPPCAADRAEIADDPLHQRLERDQAGGAAVLVDDDRLADAPAAASPPADRRRPSVSGTVSASRASVAGV